MIGELPRDLLSNATVKIPRTNRDNESQKLMNSVRFAINIHDPQRMNPNVFSDHLICSVLSLTFPPEYKKPCGQIAVKFPHRIHDPLRIYHF